MQLPDPAQMALMIPMMALLIPITALISKHFKDLAEIKARQSTGTSSEIKEQLAAIRREMAELRDTTTRFDMSFDAAITRLEQRVDQIEDVESVSSGSHTKPVVEERETVRVGRKR